MFATRAEVDLALDELRVLLPKLIVQLKEREGFWSVFTAYADNIMATASPAGHLYVRNEINAMLKANGMPPLKEPSSR